MADKKEAEAPEMTPLEEACELACRHPKLLNPKVQAVVRSIPRLLASIERRKEAAKKAKK